MDALRRGDFLDGDRVRAWLRIAAGVTAAAVAVALATSHDGRDASGKPLGTDFVSFWTASRMALAGAAPQVWDIARHGAAEAEIFGPSDGYVAFFYPPIFLLICWPLALLPPVTALAAWLTVTGGAALAALRAWSGRRLGTLAFFAFPAVFVTAGHGQTAFLTTALFAGGATLIDRRPVLAGMLFGGLAFKPHLAIVLPVLLLAGRQWRCLGAMVATGAGLAALSVAAFGIEAWAGFLATAEVARATLEEGLVDPAKMVSVFAAVKLLGGTTKLAFALHGGVAVAVLAVAVWVVRTAASGAAIAALAAAATVLASPFLLDYDLMLSAVPMIFLLREGLAGGFRDYEKIGLLAAFVLPGVARGLASAASLPLAPAVSLGLFALVVGRVRATSPR
ncbi:DUF2029 domain-containing protein [Siculibacillus lacustris]|uniref:DUF2029 domain-containing protein n=1 Tax=Siculibacillus lacustris TaxID=1549641 RepID=A0A4V2KTL3_9HYPH|nr:glycosyltransferase family 87 protein [Siculibacillus lacustris]TBW37674.1 DUF2029 domain-containing protein [Siculibacillus lacustris]